MFARLAFASLIAHALVALTIAQSAEIEYLPDLAETEPVVELESFADEPGFFRRWQQSHRRRVAEGTMIETDRPSFTLSDSTVPKGWIQVESGYTYAYGHEVIPGSLFQPDIDYTQQSHTVPELNLRWGLTNWAELRVLWGGIRAQSFRIDYGNVTERFSDTLTANLEVGAKFQTTQQRGWIPKSALVTTLFLPTSDADGEVMPLIDYIYTWSLTDQVSVGGSTGAIFSDVTTDPAIMQFFQSAILRFYWSPSVSLFFEWYTSAQKYFGDTTWFPITDAGIQWRPLANLQFDWRIGLPVGSEPQVDGVFTGVGASLRY